MDGYRNWQKLMWGVFLMAMGFAFLAERLGFLPPWGYTFSWWPLLVIGLGMIKLIQPRRARDLGGAVMMVLLGLWFLFVTNGWYGLTWGNSWPLALVAVGAGHVMRALVARWLPDARWTIVHDEEEHHA